MKSANVIAALLLTIAVTAAVFVITRGREGPRENRGETEENWDTGIVTGYAMEPGQSISYRIEVRENIFGSYLNLTGLFRQSAVDFENFSGETVLRWDVWENLEGSLTAAAGGATVSTGYALAASGRALIDNLLRMRYMAMLSEVRIEGQENVYDGDSETIVDYENMKIVIRRDGEEDVREITSVLLDIPTCFVILRENLGGGYQDNFALRVLGGLPVGVILRVEESETVDTPAGRFSCWVVSGRWGSENMEIYVRLLVSKRMDVVVGGSISFRSFTEYGVITDEQTWTLLEANWLPVAG